MHTEHAGRIYSRENTYWDQVAKYVNYCTYTAEQRYAPVQNFCSWASDSDRSENHNELQYLYEGGKLQKRMSERHRANTFDKDV